MEAAPTSARAQPAPESDPLRARPPEPDLRLGEPISPRLKGLVLLDLRQGYAPEAIVRRHAVPAALVEAMQTALLVVRGLLRSGYSQRAVYANFCDLLGKRECGLRCDESWRAK